MATQLRVCLETYGCSLNVADGEQLASHIPEEMLVDNPEEADLIIINSCGVKDPTEIKICRRTKKLLDMGKKVVVTGCLPRINTSNLDRRAIIKYDPRDVLALLGVDGSCYQGRRFRGGRSYATIALGHGCLGSCTFCAVRIARGKLRSRPKQEIVNEVRQAVSQGFKEIRLTAQDTGAYGKDISTTLPELLEEILISVPGDYLIRLGMTNPNHVQNILDELIQIYKDPRLYKFLHIPVQSGSNKILRRMGRKYTVEEYREIVEEFLGKIPELQVVTDIIVGFPFETEEDYQLSLELIKETKPHKVNIARFSKRPGTLSEWMPQIPGRIAKERSRKLQKLVHRISEDINKGFVGKQMDVLVVERGKKGGTMLGRNMSYKPVVLPSCKLGQRLGVRITGSTPTYLIGEPATT